MSWLRKQPFQGLVSLAPRLISFLRSESAGRQQQQQQQQQEEEEGNQCQVSGHSQ
jgi:hypothetical protein